MSQAPWPFTWSSNSRQLGRFAVVVADHHERGVVELCGLLAQQAEAFVFGLASQFDIDETLGLGGILEGDHPGTVFFLALDARVDFRGLQAFEDGLRLASSWKSALPSILKSTLARTSTTRGSRRRRSSLRQMVCSSSNCVAGAELGPSTTSLSAFDLQILDRAAQDFLGEFLLVLDVLLALTLLDAEQRRLR